MVPSLDPTEFTDPSDSYIILTPVQRTEQAPDGGSMTTVEELKRRDGSIDLARGARDNIRYPVRRGSQTQPP